jgi:hypothetical protein
MAYSIKRYRGRPNTIGDTTAVAAVHNKKIRVLGLVLSADGGANNVQLKSSGGTVLAQFNLTAGQILPLDLVDEAFGYWESIQSEGLVVNLSAATAVSISINGSAVD